MSPGIDYAPCSHCGAHNVTYRQVCWRCGYMLPYSIGLDGKPRLNLEVEARSMTRAEIERLLDQAQTLDVVEAKKQCMEEAMEQAAAPEPSSTRTPLRAWMWLQRRKEHPYGA